MSRLNGSRRDGEDFLTVDDMPPPGAPYGATPPRPAPSRINRIAWWLALFTFLSTFWAGATNWAPMYALMHAGAVQSLLPVRVALLANWVDGLQFSIALMGILAAHEFGHYLFTLYYRVPSTPPLFIPFPVSSLGTCGAVIAMHGGQADRRQIFDIGLAGPIAGLLVAIPILVYAMWFPQSPDYAPYKMMSLGQPLVVQWMAEWLVPDRADRYVTMLNTQASPLLMAAWSGLLVTGLNMMPVGQLDGGHVAFGLLGARSTWVGLFVMAATATYLVAFAVIYQQMHIFTPMYFLALLMGPRHPPSSDDSRTLGWPRQLIGWVSLLIPVLCIPANPLVPI